MNSLWQYAADADGIEVLSAFFHSYEEKLACKNELEKNGKLRAVESDEFNLEIMSIDAGKGNALFALADMLKVDIGDTVSIGDSDNDSSITMAAGLGLAVSNASDSLKAVADEIICSNEEHVVPYVLSHYIR
jgi:hydroxymethylpyrimidine pyrophosphatase-like HAD family hydrolase